MNRPLCVAPVQTTNIAIPHTAYQVDFMSVNCGRIVPASKRRICFKFGYTNADAFSNGRTGQECRGSEHEVVITWSLSSGKQAISFDQHEVFFDVCDSTQTKLSHSWEDKLGGHCLEVKIHAAFMSTKTNPDPNWKQYNLFVDGVSFFLMPKIFEIGVFPREDVTASFALGPNIARCSFGASSSAQAGRFRNLPKSDPDILPPEESKAPEPKPATVVDLLSFDEFDHPAAAIATPPMHTAPVQIKYAPAQIAAQTYHDPAQVSAQTNHAPAQTNQHLGDGNCISPGSGNKYCPAQDPSPFYLNASPNAMTSRSNPTPVTPQASSLALVSAHGATTSHGVDRAVQTPVNIDDLFGVTVAFPGKKESCDANMFEKDAHTSLGQLQGSKHNPNKPVRNPFNPAPARNGFAAQPLYQRQYSSYGLHQANVKPGFSYQ